MPQPTVLIDQKSPSQLAEANLVEIFSAIQGEGVNVGTRQIFVRFGGCDLRCTYCDSAHTWRPHNECEIEVEAGKRQYETFANPVSDAQLLSWILRLDQPKIHDSISFTGGEPLLHHEFLQQFLPKLKQQSDLPIYLETGGHHPDKLTPLLSDIDLIGMDIKLPSVSGEDHWNAHERFLDLALKAHTDIFCKVIVSDQTSSNELEQAAAMIRKIDSRIPCYLQPMTAIGKFTALQRDAQGVASPPNPDQVLEWQVLMKQFLSEVRVVPQTHKMIDQK